LSGTPFPTAAGAGQTIARFSRSFALRALHIVSGVIRTFAPANDACDPGAKRISTGPRTEHAFIHGFIEFNMTCAVTNQAV